MNKNYIKKGKQITNKMVFFHCVSLKYVWIPSLLKFVFVLKFCVLQKSLLSLFHNLSISFKTKIMTEKKVGIVGRYLSILFHLFLPFINNNLVVI